MYMYTHAQECTHVLKLHKKCRCISYLKYDITLYIAQTFINIPLQLKMHMYTITCNMILHTTCTCTFDGV